MIGTRKTLWDVNMSRRSIRMLTDAEEIRFWQNVGWSTDRSVCWEWQGYLENGYGVFCLDRVQLLAHRVSWRLSTGCDPSGWVLHKCDNPKCVNPYHLYEGNQRDNMHDASVRKRFPPRRGEDSVRSKLTWKKVREIRTLRAGGKGMRELSRLYHTSHSIVSRICHGERWVEYEK